MPVSLKISLPPLAKDLPSHVAESCLVWTVLAEIPEDIAEGAADMIDRLLSRIRIESCRAVIAVRRPA